MKNKVIGSAYKNASYAAPKFKNMEDNYKFVLLLHLKFHFGLISAGPKVGLLNAIYCMR